MSDTASVKISRDAKMILDSLSSQLRASGIKITEQKIMDSLIEHTDLNLIKQLLGNEDNQALEMLARPVRWGVPDSSENIDSYLYEEH